MTKDKAAAAKEKAGSKPASPGRAGYANGGALGPVRSRGCSPGAMSPGRVVSPGRGGPPAERPLLMEGSYMQRVSK
eukprot:scaffold277398_cov20-Tisochrysis_lutea.AAC.2